MIDVHSSLFVVPDDHTAFIAYDRGILGVGSKFLAMSFDDLSARTQVSEFSGQARGGRPWPHGAKTKDCEGGDFRVSDGERGESISFVAFF